MKTKMLLAVVLLITFSASVFAQGRRTPEERVKAVMSKITPALSLTPEQVPGTDSVFTGYYQAMAKLREGMAQGTRPDRSEFQKLVKERDDKLKAVWTADQFKKFKYEVEATLRPQRGNRPNGGGSNNR